MKAAHTLTSSTWQRLRHSIRKSGRLALVALAALVASATLTTASAQGLSAYAFGINYSQSGLSAGKATDLKKARLNIIRLGGNARNNEAYWRDKYNWVNDIEYVKNTLNAEPIIQLPIGLPPSEVSDWVYFFNVTKGYNIKFWTLGNEPDPGGGGANNLQLVKDWINGTPLDQHPTNGLPNNFNYDQWQARFIGLADALKQYDGTAKIIGPDFRLFYTEVINLMYAKFLTNVGHRAVAGNAGLPLLDIFSFHYYPTQGEPESSLQPRFDALKALLTSANNQRSWTDLRLAVTELNGEKTGTALPWWFNTGQFVATMSKLALANDAFCITPWSIYENSGCRCGTDYSFYNTDDSRRSTMHHFAMLSENRRANYMPPTQANYADQIVVLGMREANTANAGYTIMLMNTSSSARSFNISLNNAYQGTASNVQIKFAGYTGVTNTPLTGSIPPTTTFLFRCDASGNFVSKLIYSEADAGPHYRSALANTDTSTSAPAQAEAANAETLAIFPNPAKASFVVEGLAEQSAVTVHDYLGKTYLHKQLSPHEGIDISTLPAGFYLLSIATRQGPVVQRLVKE